jgi:MarR family transcriptional regulator, transcriptional regulator for hemolysin
MSESAKQRRRVAQPPQPTAAAEGWADPMQSMGYLCRVNFRLFARELERHIARHGVSSGQWRSLRVLWEQDGITQRELSERVGATEATTVSMIRRLVRDGFVERRPDPDDARKVRIVLTPRARRLQAKLVPYVAQVNELALQGVSEADRATVRRVLKQMADNLARAGA